MGVVEPSAELGELGEEAPTAEQLAAEAEEAEREVDVPLLRCTFAAGVLAGGLGLLFAPGSASSATTEADSRLVVAAFIRLRSGATGPAVHSGDALQPGDVICSVNDAPASRQQLTSDGELSLAMTGDLELRFTRRPMGSTSMDLGGRPAKAKPKYVAQKSMRIDGADAELLGGALSRALKKPRVVPVTERLARAVDSPTATEAEKANRLAAEVATQGPAFRARAANLRESSARARVQWEECLRQLLAQRELSAEVRTERDAEMEGATYLR